MSSLAVSMKHRKINNVTAPDNNKHDPDRDPIPNIASAPDKLGVDVNGTI